METPASSFKLRANAPEGRKRFPIKSRRRVSLILPLVVAMLVAGSVSAGTIVNFNTSVGSFDVELYDTTMPTTVANFLSYVNAGSYTSSIIHRSTTYNPSEIQIVQGGGYYVSANQLLSIPTSAPIILESGGVGNVRGTIAMARGAATDSATGQFFFNVQSNAALDGNYAVFGNVVGTAGLAALDAIGAVPVYDCTGQLGAAFGELLLTAPSLDVASFVMVNSVAVVPEPPPLLPLDTDNDGVNDLREVGDGTDPNDPSSFNPLSVGLVACYPFDGNANDESGFGDSGSVAGSAALTWNRFGHAESAYLFDGESQYITTTGSYLPRNAEPRSVSLWVRADELPTQPTISIPLAWGANADNQAFGIIMGPEIPAKWGVQFWGGGQDTMSDVNVEQKWHHLAAVYDGNNVELYVDGVNRLTSNKSTSTGAGGLSIGAGVERFVSSSSPGFKGAIDDIRIYNRALSTSDVRNLYYEEAFPAAQRTFIASNPDRFGLFSESDYLANRESGQADVTANPATFNLFTQSQFDSNRISGQTDVTTDPASFSLFTQSEYESFGTLRFRNGQSDVTTNPAAFNLFTQNQVAESYTEGQNSVLQSIPSVDFSVPASTPFRVTLSGQNVIGVVVDDTESPLPDNWRLDEQAGQLIGSVVGSNSISVVLEGEMAGGAPAIRIPLTFYPQTGQTIAPFARIPTQAFRLAPLTVTPPAASSGFAVVLSVKSGPATIVDNQVTFTGVGKVVLAANQAGNKDIKAAPEVTTSFLVTKGRQNMRFSPLSSIPFVQGGTFRLSATTTSALPIAYSSSNPRVISISGSTATIVGRGVATIRATQSGDSNWAPATPISRATRIY